MTAENNQNEPQSKNGNIDIALIQRDIVLLQKDIAQVNERTAQLQKESLVLQQSALLIPKDVEHIKIQVDKIEDTMVTREAFEPVRRVVYGMVGVMLLAVISAVLALVIRGV